MISNATFIKVSLLITGTTPGLAFVMHSKLS